MLTVLSVGRLALAPIITNQISAHIERQTLTERGSQALVYVVACVGDIVALKARVTDIRIRCNALVLLDVDRNCRIFLESCEIHVDVPMLQVPKIGKRQAQDRLTGYNRCHVPCINPKPDIAQIRQIRGRNKLSRLRAARGFELEEQIVVEYRVEPDGE